jgi:hypothetical protein
VLAFRGFVNAIYDIWMALWAFVALGEDIICVYIDASKHE